MTITGLLSFILSIPWLIITGVWQSNASKITEEQLPTTIKRLRLIQSMQMLIITEVMQKLTLDKEKAVAGILVKQESWVIHRLMMQLRNTSNKQKT